jgi:predicted Zn-ribbon and HTH transcriptional regulator
MDLLTLMGGVGLVGAVLALILYPLWPRHRSRSLVASDPTRHTLAEAEIRYQAALATIKELMFDYEMGKTSEADYEILLTKAKVEAAHIRRQLDRLTQQVDLDPVLEAEIERLVADLRANASTIDPTVQQEVEAELSQLLTRNVASSRTCPHCGKMLILTDAFCSGCGQALDPLEVIEAKQGCPKCGYAFQEDDAFCAQCGLPLAEASLQPTPAK